MFWLHLYVSGKLPGLVVNVEPWSSDGGSIPSITLDGPLNVTKTKIILNTAKMTKSY